MVGRWVRYLPGGKVFHDDIAAAAPFPQEVALGWCFHYVVGIVYGGMLVAAAGSAWLASPTFLPAWILGLVTVGAGWFLLAPGMVVTEVCLRMRQENSAQVSSRVRELVTKRKTSQPSGYPNSGSMFRNPTGDFAGRLIEAAGLKGKRIGHAQISERRSGSG